MKFVFADRLGIDPKTLDEMDCTDAEGLWIILEKEIEERGSKAASERASGVSDRVFRKVIR